jgi:hypothetical protein
MPRSNGFAGSIAGAVLEAPSEELKIKPTEIPESIPMMFVVSGKSQEAPVPEQLSRLLSGCGRLSSIQSAIPVVLVANTTDTDLLALRPTCKTSSLDLREFGSDYPSLLATLVASSWDSPDRALSIKAWVAISPSSIPASTLSLQMPPTKHLH